MISKNNAVFDMPHKVSIDGLGLQHEERFVRPHGFSDDELLEALDRMQLPETIREKVIKDMNIHSDSTSTVDASADSSAVNNAGASSDSTTESGKSE